MSKRINLMANWREFNKNNNTPSITDYFQDSNYEYQNEMADYLDNGEISLTSLDFGYDVINGNKISNNYFIMTDGEFSWDNTLSYYVRKYNLRLPSEFERKVINNLKGKL